MHILHKGYFILVIILAFMSSSALRKLPMPSRFNVLSESSVWTEFSSLGRETGAYNLGQGFPSWSPPKFCIDALIDATKVGSNHAYARCQGHLPLVNALSKRYTKDLERRIDSMSEVLVTVGASAALCCALQAVVDNGDEVILFEPAFDIYEPQTNLAGGICKYVPLHLSTDGKWTLNSTALEAAITPKTRAIIVNTPHNPTGKVFTIEELSAIATVVKKYPDIVVITDEVYEHILFDGNQHRHMAALPGMWDRTITISSAGKVFSATGWKIGWAVGPQELISRMVAIGSVVNFCVATPLQQAVADSMSAADEPYGGFPNYYDYLSNIYAVKRDRLLECLKSIDMHPCKPEGGMFILSDISNVEVPSKYLEDSTPACPIMTRDWAFCRWLTLEKGVLPIPTSAFYCSEHKALGSKYTRFAFCKDDDTIDGAIKVLRNNFKRVHDSSYRL
eukprot:397280_1